VVCGADEPESLFLYGKSNKTADLIHKAIYDGPFDRVAYQRPVDRGKTSIDDGVQLFTSRREWGDLISDVEGNTVNLASGVNPYPRGCQSGDCAIHGTEQARYRWIN
jgi:hypothetical protein